jgi:hypothetical protein
VVKPMTKGFNRHKGLFFFFQNFPFQVLHVNLRNVKLGLRDPDLVLKLEI